MDRKLPLPRGWNRWVKSSMLHGTSDTYPAGTTFDGPRLPPAGTTDVCTAHVDSKSNGLFPSNDEVRLI